jgi:hypothetical protein
MKGIMFFTAICALSILSLTINTPEVAGTLDPVASYSGMMTVCEQGGLVVRIEDESGATPTYGSTYVLPFPRPPGYLSKGNTHNPADDARVLVKSQTMDTKGEMNSEDHMVSSNITGCEAWVSIVPREDAGVPYIGSPLTGKNLDSGGDIEANIALAIFLPGKPKIEADPIFYWSDNKYPTGRTSEGHTYYLKSASLSQRGTKTLRVGAYSDLEGSVNCDSLYIMVRNITAFDPVTGNALDYNGNPRDDCAIILWGMAVYYDVAVPFQGQGVFTPEGSSDPLSVRAIIRELTAT